MSEQHPQVILGGDHFAGIHLARCLEDEPVRALTTAALDDPLALASALADADVAYLCAETPADLRSAPFSRQPLLVEKVVRAARTAGVRRLVHVSTADVLGSELRGRMSETSHARPENAYERLKLREEQYLRSEVDDLDWVIVRPARGIGAHDRLWAEHLLRRLEAGGRLWQVAGGRVFQTFIAGADLGRALMAAGKRGQAGHTYLAGGFDATWRDLIEVAAAQLGVAVQVQPLPFDVAFAQAAARELTTGYGRTCWPNRYAIDAYGRVHLYDDSRSRRQLTWSPQVGSFAEVMGEVVRWYRDQGPPLGVSGQPGRSPS